MNIREYLNNNSAVATIAAVALLVVSLGIILISNRGGGGGSVDVYFYDLNTQKLVTASSDTLSPVDLGGGTFTYPDGAAGSAVRAIVFSCTDCEGITAGMSLADVEAAGGFIGYVQMMPKQARELQQRSLSGEQLTDQEYGMLSMDASMISDTNAKHWVSMQSEEAMRLMDTVTQRCQGAQIVACLP